MPFGQALVKLANLGQIKEQTRVHVRFSLADHHGLGWGALRLGYCFPIIIWAKRPWPGRFYA